MGGGGSQQRCIVIFFATLARGEERREGEMAKKSWTFALNGEESEQKEGGVGGKGKQFAM